jgi:hypothetical protein
MSYSIIAKNDAIRKSLTRYFTGTPCNRGHVSERFTSSDNCIDCVKLLARNKALAEMERVKSLYEFEYIDRKVAKEYGITKYFTGTECKHGHVSERNTANGACLECARINRTLISDYARSKKNKIVREQRKNHSKEVKRRRRANSRAYSRKAKDNLTQSDKEKRTTYYREYMREKRKNPTYKAKCSLRGMLRRVLEKTGKSKAARSEEMIGYTHEELKGCIESKFKDGMKWENRSEWHIDHIKPIQAFLDEGVTDPSIINSLSNLQPLWAMENIKKGANY